MANIIEKLTEEKAKEEKILESYQKERSIYEKEYTNGQDYLNQRYHYDFLKSNVIGDTVICILFIAFFSAMGIVLASATGLYTILGALVLDFFMVKNIKKMNNKRKKGKEKLINAYNNLTPAQKNVLIEDQNLMHDLELRVFHRVHDYNNKIEEKEDYIESLDTVLSSESPLDAIEQYLDTFPIYREVLKEEWDEFLLEYSHKDVKDLHLTDCDVTDEEVKEAINTYLGDTNILEKKLTSKK